MNDRESTPKWATDDDLIQLKKFLKENENPIIFPKDDTSDEQRLELNLVLKNIFWEELSKEKHG